MDKCYKYASISSAMKILESESVLLSNPCDFNDPFDSLLSVNETNKNKMFNLLLDYYTFKSTLELLKNNTYNPKGFGKFAIDFFKLQANLYKKMIAKTKTYKESGFFSLMLKILSKSNAQFKKELDLIKEKIYVDIENKINSLRKEILITCFSDRNDSVLMWSHYADSHKGVCIEIEKEDFIKNVKYSNKITYLDLYELSTYILGADFLNSKIDLTNPKLIDKLSKPIFTKTKDWKYEKETRCIFSKNDKNRGLYFIDDKWFIKVKIKTIFIGINADSSANKLIELANQKGIKIVYMSKDKDKYKVVPKAMV